MLPAQEVVQREQAAGPPRRARRRQPQEPLQPAPGLAPRLAGAHLGGGGEQLQAGGGARGVGGPPGERGAHALQLPAQPPAGRVAAGVHAGRLRGDHGAPQGEAPGAVAVAHRAGLSRLQEALPGVLAQRLQQAVALLGAAALGQHQRLVHQPREEVKHLAPRHRVAGPPPPRPPRGGSPPPRPREDGQAPEQGPLGRTSRSWLQSTVACSVCCRRRAVRPPPVRSRKRSPRRAASCSGVSTRTRAAASSMARGMPSRRRQTSATAGAFAFVISNSGCTVRARSRKRRPASHRSRARGVRPPRQAGAGQGRGRARRSPRRGRAARGWWPAPAPPGSRGARRRPGRRQPRARARSCPAGAGPSWCAGTRPGGLPGAGPAPRRRAQRGQGGDGHQRGVCQGGQVDEPDTVRVARRREGLAPSCRARRVLPVPPVPVRVSRRAAAEEPRHLRQLPLAARRSW